MFQHVTPSILSACILLAGCSSVIAQPADSFYSGKTIQVIIGVGPGGGYDTWGRIVGRHIGKHIAGRPNVVPKNMPGAGGIVAANHLYTSAPRDGTVIGIVNRDAPLAQLTGSASARFDATKLSWIGTPTVETNVCIVSPQAKVRTVEELRNNQLVLGAVGPGSGSYNYPVVLSGLLDLKIKLISGFPGSTEVFLAMDRGEVDGMCESLDGVESKRPGAIAEKKLHILFQGGLEASRDLKGVPLILDYARNDEERQTMSLLYAGQGLGRPFLAPPDLVEGRLATLRTAFDATMKDPEFLEEAARSRLDVDPRTGAELEALVVKLYASPKELVQRLQNLLR
jgi:tripartite-type tricarboxylate transporter receptor subunit TctC